MNPVAEDILMHYGVKRRSGRWPWGSGENPYQHSGDFLARIETLKKNGWKETAENIEKEFGISTTDYRAAKAVAKHERHALLADRARSMRDDGKTLQEIADALGYPSESSVRHLLDEDVSARASRAKSTADILKKELETKGMIDIGAGAERDLGVSAATMKEAMAMLEMDGYVIKGVGVPYATVPGKQLTMTVLAKPGTEYKDIYAARDAGEIGSVGDYHSVDGGQRWDKIQYPASISSDRVGIRYGDEGGSSKDGVIEIRRGVDDLSLGNSHYAQVRILVDGTHYLKGMAMYSDDLPEGVDILFNTNKQSGTPKEKVMKGIKDDPDNPFGAYIPAKGQSTYIGEDGQEHLSAINKLKSEGEWDTMSRTLSSQFLSKQPMKLINQQLKLTYDDAQAQFDEICSLENPTLKKKMLLDFADECDSACVHLKAAALPRQKQQVILPIDNLKDNEVYAPGYQNGEKVVLIRYPHGGTFEIPELTVNNRNKAARSILGTDIVDAIGINSKVAERLSGADFDGDTVTVIPVNDRVHIQTSSPLKELKGFDPKVQYSTEGKTGVKLMTKSQTQKEMGMVSNLITDMTLQGANEAEIARAVKHSMVVIDAEKHHLDYKQSEKDNGIAELRQKYQPKYDEDGNPTGKGGGAHTLISRKKQDVRIDERKGSGRIDPETGEVTYKKSGRTYVDKNGKRVKATDTVKLMDITKDAHELSSGTRQEEAYADYVNKMKALANTARKEYMATPGLKRDPSAAKTYEKEVKELSDALDISQRNAPRERQAQLQAHAYVKAKVDANPELRNDKKTLRKVRQQAINDARVNVGASGKNTRIDITDRQWEAIQAGAISDSKLKEILRFADQDALKERALPKTRTQLSEAKIAKINSMKASGYTMQEIAAAVGCSTSTISQYIQK